MGLGFKGSGSGDRGRVPAERALELRGGLGEAEGVLWGGVGRCGEMRGDVGRCLAKRKACWCRVGLGLGLTLTLTLALTLALSLSLTWCRCSVLSTSSSIFSPRSKT